jgi:ribulose-5-phosphate 4-epimerase/fuculose-1-phosphate aldolase
MTAFFIGNSYCNLCQANERQLTYEIVNSVEGLIAKGMRPVRGAAQSARLPGSKRAWFLWLSRGKTSIEYSLRDMEMTDDSVAVTPYKNDNDRAHGISFHKEIYELRPDVNAIFYTMNPYTISAVNRGLKLVHAEAALILGDVPIVVHESPPDRADPFAIKSLANASVGEPLRPVRTIVSRHKGVIALGACVHEARAFIEIIEEWARFEMVAFMHGSPRNVLTIEQLRKPGARYARSIKFGGRQISSTYSA